MGEGLIIIVTRIKGDDEYKNYKDKVENNVELFSEVEGFFYGNYLAIIQGRRFNFPRFTIDEIEEQYKEDYNFKKKVDDFFEKICEIIKNNFKDKKEIILAIHAGLSDEDLLCLKNLVLKTLNEENKEECYGILKNIKVVNYTIGGTESIENEIAKVINSIENSSNFTQAFNKLFFALSEKKKLRYLIFYILHIWFPVLIEVQGINEIKNYNEKSEYFKEAFCLDENRLIKYLLGSYFIVYGKEANNLLKDFRHSRDIKEKVVSYLQKFGNSSLDIKELCENKAFLTQIKELIKDQNLNKKIKKFFDNSFKKGDGCLYRFCIEMNNCCAKEDQIEECLNRWNIEKVTYWYNKLCNILGEVNDKVMS